MKKNESWREALQISPPDWVPERGKQTVVRVEPDIRFAALAAWPKPANCHWLIVVESLTDAEALVADLNAFLELLGEPAEAVLMPELETTRKHLMPENEAERSRVLNLTRAPVPRLFIASAMSATSPSAAPDRFHEEYRELRVGDDSLPPESLAEYLVKLDYDNEAEVHLPGEFSWRGGILDVYSPVHEYPVRVEYFGNEIESLRFFDPETQRSIEQIKTFTLIPRGESAFLEDGTENETDARTCFLDFFPPERTILALCDPAAIAAHLEQYGQQRDLDQWQRYLESEACQLLVVEALEQLDTGDTPVQLFPGFALTSQLRGLFPEFEHTWESLHQQTLATQLERWHDTGYRFLVCCSSRSKEARFEEFLQNNGLADLAIDYIQAPISCGLLLPGDELVILTDAEIFGKPAARPRRRRHSSYHTDRMLHEGTELNEGDFAVHAAYGICRFLGLKMESFHDRQQEVLVLQFANDVKVFVPLAQAYLVSRYVGSGKKLPKLSKVGGTRWKSQKEQAEDAINDMAAELIQVQAVRAASEGYRFLQDHEAIHLFDEAFPYTETEDQLRAIDAVRQDMAESKPMDRLICGDVGFGKTEVAMRAAFQAVLNDKQVAVLVPTTVLSQQHFLNFSQRFREYPVIIENLSRFLTPHRQREILEATREGRVDILIGTHRLLSGDAHFKDLGLLVVDEEQRFGVKHKEKLKRLRADIDILTMTATPIPRTLYMSLAGLRDLSTIVTPPRERLPVQTVVAQYDETLITQAIRRELQREGQVFFVHNRVKSIDKVAAKLKKLVPEARICVGHGQMAEGQLEKTMLRFIEGEADILVCTTIIESGVDITNANTIIIDRADRFGLADLYQLRGRVGRYHRQAYAYLLIPEYGVLLDNARKRLSAIRKYTQLGAGFKLAMRDLEIRGAGNILGSEQSGHIAAIGFDLYCQLLREAVARMKSQPIPRRISVQIDLPFVVYGETTDPDTLAACLPRHFVNEETLRVDLYRRLSNAQNEEQIQAWLDELRDRFGDPPAAVHHLVNMNRLRLYAHQAGIHSVQVRDENRVLLETDSGYLKESDRRMPRLDQTEPKRRLEELVLLVAELARLKS